IFPRLLAQACESLGAAGRLADLGYRKRLRQDGSDSSSYQQVRISDQQADQTAGSECSDMNIYATVCSVTCASRRPGWPFATIARVFESGRSCGDDGRRKFPAAAG